MPSITEVIPVIALVISAIALFRNMKHDNKAEAGELTTIIVKLESISDNVKEVKADIKDVKGDIERLRERLVVVEESTKSAHKRLDKFNDKTE